MTRKPIVVGVDGSLESRRAAVIGHTLAQAGGVRCQLVHAFPDLGPPVDLGRPLTAPQDVAHLLSEAHRRVAASLLGSVPDALVSRLETRPGGAARVLADVAEAMEAGLAVVGGRRHGAVVRGLGGSTAHRLVRTLDVPVLVTGAAVPRARVLAAVDLSEAARATLSTAATYARQLEAELRIVHVVEPARFPRVVPLAVDDAEFHRRSADALGALLRAARLGRTDHVLRSGVAVEAVAAEAAEWEASLLVVGSHGKGLLNRLVIGSTTEGLLNLLPTSLLIVPTAGARARRTRARRRRRTVTGRVS